MSDIVPFSASPESAETMTSVEIAEITDKQHGHIIRDIKTMLAELYEEDIKDDPKLDHFDSKGFSLKKDARGYVVEFSLNKRLTLTLTSGYSIKQRAAIIDRWLELEALSAPQSPTEMLVIYAQRLLEQERRQKEAERIANEARQLAVDSNETIKRVEARQEMVEKGFHDFSILAYAGYRSFPSLDLATATRMGKKASKICKERGEPIGRIRDPRFGHVNTYPEHILEQLFQDEFDF